MNTNYHDTIATLYKGMTVMNYHYIACPYSDDDAEVRNQRYLDASKYVAQELLRGVVVYSPIVHCHNLQLMYPTLLPTTFDFWRNIDFTMLSKASRMDVLMMPGWDKSVGVREEIAFCTRNNIDIHYVMWPNEFAKAV